MPGYKKNNFQSRLPAKKHIQGKRRAPNRHVSQRFRPSVPFSSYERNRRGFTLWIQSVGNELRELIANKERHFAYFISALSVTVIFICLTAYVGTQTNSLTKKHQPAYNHLQELTEAIQNKNIAYLDNILENEIPEEDTKALINEKFNYFCYVNGRNINASNIYINGSSCTIEIYESIPSDIYATFSERLIKNASFIPSDSLPQQFMINSGDHQPELTYITARDSNRLQLQFEDLAPGDIIEINIQFSFAQRMKYKSNSIKVIVR